MGGGGLVSEFMWGIAVIVISKKLSGMNPNNVGFPSVPLKYTVDTYTSMC